MKLFVKIILLLAITANASAQLPHHTIHWPFNNVHWDNSHFLAIDPDHYIIPYLVAETSDIIVEDFVTDRHGNNTGAISMKSESKINFSSNGEERFFGLTDGGIVDAMTISLWIKFDGPKEEERILFGAKESLSEPVKFGMSLKNKTLYLKRYFEHPDKSIGVAWDYECFQPGAFDAGTGWYHVIMVFSRTQKYMRLFLGKPNGGAVYGPGADTNDNVPGTATVTREFDGRLIWIPGIRDGLSDFDYWFMGDADGLVFDDLMIFNYDLTLEEAKALWNYQKPGSSTSSTARVAEGVSEKEQEEAETASQSIETENILYPNPASENFNLLLALEEEDEVRISIISLSGSLIEQRKEQVGAGHHYLSIDLPSNMNRGVYLVEVRGSATDYYYKTRLMIE